MGLTRTFATIFLVHQLNGTMSTREGRERNWTRYALWSNTRYRLNIPNFIIHTVLLHRFHRPDKCYIKLRSVRFLRSAAARLIASTTWQSTAHALAIPFSISFSLSLNTASGPTDSRFRIILNAHREYFTQQRDEVFFLHDVLNRRRWSTYAPTSSTSYVLIFLNVFRFRRFFLSLSFFSFPPFSFRYRAMPMYTLCQVKPTMNVQLFLFSSECFDLRSRNRTIISSVARYIALLL